MATVVENTVPVYFIVHFGIFGILVPHIILRRFLLVILCQCLNILLRLLKYIRLQSSQLLFVECNQLHLLSHSWLCQITLGQFDWGKIDAANSFADVEERRSGRIGMVHLAETLVPLLG